MPPLCRTLSPWAPACLVLQPYRSRHTVVCRAAQEAGAQPREYIDRKKENAIFAPP